MLARNCSQLPQKHWCITDDPDSLPDYVTAIPADPAYPGWWQKLRLFAPEMPWAEGERIFYVDLDSAIVGRLEDMADTPGLMRDWMTGAHGSTAMVWDHGEHRNVYSTFADLSAEERARVMNQPLKGFTQPYGDQDWLTDVSRGEWNIWPIEWCVSYKEAAKEWPPGGSKIIVFHGDPKPPNCGGWVPDVWKIGGHTSLPKMSGVNTSYATIWSNIETNVARDLPWFLGALPHANAMVLVCGGPSLRDSVQQIKDHKRRGARIVTVNNAMRYLMSHGVVPDVHVMLDARPENAEFVKDAPADVQYFIASQCHPDVFEALKDREVTVWHNAIGDGEELERMAEPHKTPERTAGDGKVLQVPGGGTVGLRCLWLALFSGYRKLHVYGMDGSYEEGQHHAYSQTLNDGEDLLQITMGGRHYACAKWMARQADEFRWHYTELVNHGMRLHVHGRGLIPDLAKAMREEMRAAA
jgi:hypothetical protein